VRTACRSVSSPASAKPGPRGDHRVADPADRRVPSGTRHRRRHDRRPDQVRRRR
jgi:hypothetical protein